MPRRNVGGLYGKPLLGTDIQQDPEKALRRLKSELQRRLKSTLMLTAFSAKAKKRIAESLQIKILPSSLRITTNFKGFFPLVKGQKTDQMTWLTKAKSPIPIVLDSGEVIFRNATPQSMQNGSWWHPGRDSSDFVSKAKKETRKFVKARLQKEMMKQLKSAITQKR
jgi:hypothetical protein